jgi:DNA polymerase (family 10)
MLAFKNSKVAKTLREYSALLGVSGGTPFKANAYQRAAETIESMATSIPAFISAGHNLQELPGVGAGIAGVIQEIVSTGKLKQLKSLSSGLDPSLIELAGVPGLNPKRVASIYKKLNIHSLAELRERSLSGEILDRMGPRFDFEVREALSDRPRLLFKRAWELACTMKSFIEQLPGKLAESRDIDFSRDGMETDGIKLSTEAAVYRALELDFVEPELREGRGSWYWPKATIYRS